ncbi:hypothetical protein KOW79_011198 [Hemibagrus wyckioides]|uniref:Uncharacterized protein n=1 Tax=Hemibagrus wyckioides TaxID=337641 RepID=A0A9D3NMD5_9TELE|nr:hypothetical protein KOW79_011198 [Hemibagrus wyckioides]
MFADDERLAAVFAPHPTPTCSEGHMSLALVAPDQGQEGKWLVPLRGECQSRKVQAEARRGRGAVCCPELGLYASVSFVQDQWPDRFMMWAREGLRCNNTTALASTDCLCPERLTANGIVGTMQIWEEIFNKPAKLTRSTLSV